MDTTSISIGATRYGGTRHPFRATLPRHVLRTLPQHEPEIAAQLSAAARSGPDAAEGQAGRASRRALRLTTQDVKDFLLAYTACLMALLTFLG